MAAGVVGAICIALTRETARRPLDGSAPIVESRDEDRDVVSARR
jgi:MHS family proline/betaine transporter-like MFS transporter